MKYNIITFRNFKDFKYGSFRYELNSKGELIIFGKLKKSKGNGLCKFQETKMK